jgi:hypothetical protein
VIRDDDEGEDAPPAFARKGLSQPDSSSSPDARRRRALSILDRLHRGSRGFPGAIRKSSDSARKGQRRQDDRVTDVRASFARNYGSKGGLAKSADAQRQAFTRALKGVLDEGIVKQESSEGKDWLWRKDE